MSPPDWLQIGATLHGNYLPALIEPRGRVGRLGDLVATDHFDSSPGVNVGTVVRPIGPAGSADVAGRLAAFYGVSPGGGYALFDNWQAIDLSPFGFAGSKVTFMVRQPGPLAVTEAADLEVHEATTRADIAAFGRVFSASFGLEGDDREAAARFVSIDLATVNFRMWLGSLAGEPVCCASAFVGSGGVYVDFVSTLPASRGRGFARAVTTWAIAADSTRPTMLHAGPAAGHMYASLEFEAIAEVTIWTHPGRQLDRPAR